MVLKLYVAGRTQRSEQAMRCIREIGERDLAGAYELAVFDVLEHPGLAEQKGILATPTLVREAPLPLRRIVGDLTDKVRVLRGLGLATTAPTAAATPATLPARAHAAGPAASPGAPPGADGGRR